MFNKFKNLLLFIAVCISIRLFLLVLSWLETSEAAQFLSQQSLIDDPQLIPYHHVIDQLQWITKFSTNNVDFVSNKAPKIFYDRINLYHPTESAGCRYKCIFTNDTHILGEGDVVVFSYGFQENDAIYFKERGVLIVFETGESPIHAPYLHDSQSIYIDLFITYMAKSPVPYMYSMFVRNTRPKYKFTAKEIEDIYARNYTHLLPQYHRYRTKMIAWAVSNNDPSNNRAEFANAIAEFIPVDIYGARNKKFPIDVDAFQYLSKNYKFYLAFENSNCRNYITEKVQRNAMLNDMVPIVLGAYKEDYEGVLPPHSYINVDDFKSIRELTDYLRYLDRNDTAYAAYFAWKEYGKIHDIERLDCRLCGYIHQLNAGEVQLPKQQWHDFLDPTSLCFKRPLLPRG